MAKTNRKNSRASGLPPGSLIHIGDQKVNKVKITIFDYNLSEFIEKTADTIEESFAYKDRDTITWINIDGISDISIIEKINQYFGVHPLVLEDILNTSQRPKMEDFVDYLFFVLKMIYIDDKTKQITSEQVSLILGSNYVISFQEKEGDVFDPVRDRIRNNKGRVRKLGSDYLAYSLIDLIVDSYFSILEKQGDEIELIEEEVIKARDNKIMQKLHRVKRDLISLRKNIWPLREMVNSFIKSESKLIAKTNHIYFADVYDHTIQAIDTIETFRDMTSGLHDIYLSVISNRMNEVMKVLTMFASVFIPLTFIAGIYGMNFEYMPELKLKYGYFYVLGLMFILAVFMLIYFKRRKWF